MVIKMKEGNHLLIRIAVALFIVLCVATIIDLQLRINKLDDQKEALEKEIFTAEEQLAELQYKLALPYDNDYAARVARKQLGYHYPDEVLFINDLYEE